jgi:hypothetical protein
MATPFPRLPTPADSRLNPGATRSLQGLKRSPCSKRPQNDGQELIWPHVSTGGNAGLSLGCARRVVKQVSSRRVTPDEERDARSLSATMDHSDIRGLVTALHRCVAGLPRSSVGDHRFRCPRSTFEDSPHRVRASRSQSVVIVRSGVISPPPVGVGSSRSVQVCALTWRARSHIKPASSRAMAMQILL